MKCVATVLGLTLWGLAGQAAAEILAVSPDGTGDYPTIQAAVDAAVDGDVIELTDGIFTGHGNRDVSISRKQITVRSQGGADACIIDCQGSHADRHRGFRFVDYEGYKSVLQGVTITNGYQSQGGGMICLDARPTIADCVFVENTATGEGGAVCIDSWAAPRFVRCLFRSNTSGVNGGGVSSCYGSYPTFEGCTFRENRAMVEGGAVRL